MVYLPPQIDDEEHRTAYMVHGVECCAQIKQDECAVTSPRSIARMISFMTLTTAVSVLWCRRYTDWFDRNNLWRSSCAVNLVTTTRSANLEVKRKFDIGRYELASSASTVGFLSRGKSRADFCVSGRSPDCSDALQISLSTGASQLECRKHVSRAKLALDPTNNVWQVSETAVW